MSEKNRFHAAISASSVLSSADRVPSRFLSSKSPVRCTDSSKGRKTTISLGCGPRAKNSMTSCAKALLAEQGRPRPRSMTWAKSSRPESSWRASLSGRSLVTCTDQRLTQPAGSVKSNRVRAPPGPAGLRRRSRDQSSHFFDYDYEDDDEDDYES